MTVQGYLSLAVQSVFAPRDVARLLLSIRLGREALITAFALVLVLDAFMMTASRMLVPSTLPLFLSNPMVLIAMQAATVAGVTISLTWVGKIFDGKAQVEDMALLVIWLQGLFVLVQAMIVLLVPLSPTIGGFVQLAATGMGLWILIAFIDEVHELSNIWKAALVLLLGIIAFAFGLTILLTLIGVSPEGMGLNV